MQKDFHYGVIKVLAQRAGFDPEQSQLIAYASQYTDDATLHRPIRLDKELHLDTPRARGKIFDPVCTAHKGVQFLEDFKRSVQEQIYLSFHFLPSKPYTGQSDYDYVVRPDSELAQVLIYWALSKLKIDPQPLNFIRLGIALHTYADTWSHQNFTGTHCHKHNDIEHIEIWTGEHWKPIKPYRQFLNNIFPDIGHAEAYDFPDRPYLRWRYIKEKTKELVLRDNPSIFLQAAQKIYKILCEITGKECEQQTLNKLNEFFNFHAESLQRRLQYLNSLFPEVEFSYDPHQWLNQAIYIKNLKPHIRLRAKLRSGQNWFLFHIAAYEQRLFVLSKIKRLIKFKNL